MDDTLDRVHWISVVTAMLALCGLLVMHGFEGALVHPDHAGPSGHVAGIHLSSGEQHVQHGTCSLELPQPDPVPHSTSCQSGSMPAGATAAPQAATLHPWTFANRAVLTAHSILRV